MWEHKKKRGKQKPRKSRLLSSTKGEENRIELYMVAINDLLCMKNASAQIAMDFS